MVCAGHASEIDGRVAGASADEIISDLHALLAAAGQRGPFVLVGHSRGGVYVRRYATKYPAEVSALVLVDSAHEEQAW
jgi:pimeloyl-ACP methyl ester carboxylesterase